MEKYCVCIDNPLPSPHLPKDIGSQDWGGEGDALELSPDRLLWKQERSRGAWEVGMTQIASPSQSCRYI